MAGIFISKGMSVAVPKFTISIDEDGNISTSDLTLHLRYDICPTWMKLSLRHLEEAKTKKIERETAWAGTNEDQKAATLESEFESSMQAIMAAAIAIDAFYSIMQAHIVLPPSLIEKWRTKRTSRYSQITEVLRRAFNLKSNRTVSLRQDLKELYRYRDLAVHPSGKIEAPIFHPELNVGVEWRFAYFRAHNAELAVNSATWILWVLAHGEQPKNSNISEYMDNLRLHLTELFPSGHPTAAIAIPPP